MGWDATLNRLERLHAEWAPWLAVVRCVLRETESGRWNATVPSRTDPQPMKPLLAGATIAAPSGLIDDLLRTLVRTAAASGTPEMTTLSQMSFDAGGAVELFTASLQEQSPTLARFAETHGADAGALQSVSALLPVPFLQACHRRWAASLPESWVQGYCPLCGAWPTFAEVRGIERRRYYRCGRCGGAWHSSLLSCAYCGMADHDRLLSLIPEKGAGQGVVEACSQCLGYVKTFTRLQGCPPDEVMLEDMASVDLDVAALTEGYTRPADGGYLFTIAMRDDDSARSVSGTSS